MAAAAGRQPGGGGQGNNAHRGERKPMGGKMVGGGRSKSLARDGRFRRKYLFDPMKTSVGYIAAKPTVSCASVSSNAAAGGARRGRR